MIKTPLPILCLVCFSTFGQLPNGKIIFAASLENENKHWQLFVINSDGSSEQQLTHSNESVDLPSVFQNSIVYRQVDSNNVTAGFLASGMNGGIARLLTSDKNVCYPKWEPGGRRIAYEYYSDNSCGIWVMDNNGDHKHLLIPDARHPAWSGDGQKMAFTRNYEIYIMDFKTGTQTQVTHLTSKDIAAKFPALSTDGNKIAFVAYYGEHPRKIGTYIIDLRNKEKQKIIEGCSMPCWTSSPKYIVCTCSRKKGESQQIAMVNVETGEKTFITNNKRMNDFPVWINLQ